MGSHRLRVHYEAAVNQGGLIEPMEPMEGREIHFGGSLLEYWWALQGRVSLNFLVQQWHSAIS